MQTTLEQVLALYVPAVESRYPGKSSAAAAVVRKFWDARAENCICKSPEGSVAAFGQIREITKDTYMSVLRELARRNPEMNLELKACCS